MFAFLAMVFLGGGCLNSDSSDTQATSSSVIDRTSILFEAQEQGLIMDAQEIAAMANASLAIDPLGSIPQDFTTILTASVQGWLSAALADVTGGDGYGIAHATIESGVYSLIAEVGNLPEPAAGYFYEGWLVRRGDELSVLSVGRLSQTEKGYANAYRSQTDLLDHAFYVLTLEADDGNSAPGEHILEGTFK